MLRFVKQVFTALTGLLCGILLVYGFASTSVAQAQVTSCDLINYQDEMVVFFAPMDATAQIKDFLPKNEPYTMIGASDGFFQIRYGDGQQGWIRFHTRVMNGACTIYIENPHESIPLSEFPTVCLYTIDETLMGYNDPELTQPHGGFGMREPGTYAVTEIIGNAVGLNGSLDMSGGYVDGTVGTFSGHCEGSIQLATAQDNARVWSQPDVTTGEVVTTFDIGAEVSIVDGPISGRIQTDSTLVGDWYQVIKGDISGWVWENRLTFGRTFTASQSVVQQATVTDNARLWSEPNAKAGQIIMTIPEGTTIDILGEPQTGFLQYDSDLTGNWYPVQIGGTNGWIYEGRINFSTGSD